MTLRELVTRLPMLNAAEWELLRAAVEVECRRRAHPAPARDDSLARGRMNLDAACKATVETGRG